MSIWNLIFPKKCVGCGEFIGKQEEVFCTLCAAKYEQLKRQVCRACGRPHASCRCKATKLKGEANVSERHLFAFEGELARSVIYKFKRKNLRGLQNFLARECAALLAEEVRAEEKLVLTYPPRSGKGLREYGFDQAYILAREMGKMLAIPVEKAFVRSGNCTEQKKLSAKEREENANEAYFLDVDAELSGRTVVAVDDVVTSGSTAYRLCKLAKFAGAKRVIVISAAKT